MFKSKVFVAELIGTFALTFIGAGAGITGAGLVGVALAHGLTLAVFAYAYGNISGTHVNPAVTFGLALNKTVTWADAVFNYWIAQFLGASVAALLLYWFVGDISGGATVGSLTSSAPFVAMLVEAVLTFFLVNTVLHAAVAGKAGPLAGWAIGATLTFAILAGGSLTGASLNPARTFGPAIFTGALADASTYLVYFVGPLFGAAVAAFVYKFLSNEK
jgi:aquaporin Z